MTDSLRESLKKKPSPKETTIEATNEVELAIGEAMES